MRSSSRGNVEVRRMKAAVYYETGGPEVFRYEDVPDPECDVTGVLVTPWLRSTSTPRKRAYGMASTIRFMAFSREPGVRTSCRCGWRRA